MSTAQRAYVVPDGRNWRVKVHGIDVGDLHPRVGLAIGAAREWLHADGGGELFVLAKDGKIQTQETVGRSPVVDWSL